MSGGCVRLPDLNRSKLAFGFGCACLSGHGTPDDQPNAYGGGEAYDADDLEDEPATAAVAQRKLDATEQLGRNDPCWCGSGKKFKKCHGA